jgi:hypothetical protein
MKAADILPYQRIHFWNPTNGHQPSDVVILATFADDAQDRIIEGGDAPERAGPERPLFPVW